MYTLGLAREAAPPLRTPGLSHRCRSTGRQEAQPPDPRAGAHTALAAHRCGPRRPHPGGAGRLRPGRGGPPAPKRRGGGPRAPSASCRRTSPASASRIGSPTEAPPLAAGTRRRRSRKPFRRDSSRRRDRQNWPDRHVDDATNAIKAAYRRTDIFERRRVLLEQRAAFLAGTEEKVLLRPGLEIAGPVRLSSPLPELRVVPGADSGSEPVVAPVIVSIRA